MQINVSVSGIWWNLQKGIGMVPFLTLLVCELSVSDFTILIQFSNNSFKMVILVPCTRFFYFFFQYHGNCQGSTMTIIFSYVITYVCQTFEVCKAGGVMSKSMYQAPYLLPSNFPNNFSKSRSYLNRMEDCQFGKNSNP